MRIKYGQYGNTVTRAEQYGGDSVDAPGVDPESETLRFWRHGSARRSLEMRSPRLLSREEKEALVRRLEAGERVAALAAGGRRKSLYE
jgi:hypothetical protein